MPDSSGFLLYRKFVQQVNHWATRSCKPGQRKRLLILPREWFDADAPGLMCGSRRRWQQQSQQPSTIPFGGDMLANATSHPSHVSPSGNLTTEQATQPLQICAFMKRVCT